MNNDAESRQRILEYAHTIDFQALREAENISRRELAQTAGISENQLFWLERGVAAGSAATWARVFVALERFMPAKTPQFYSDDYIDVVFRSRQILRKEGAKNGFNSEVGQKNV
jgi:transcriptional regulator with XRE-family HTH domain